MNQESETAMPSYQRAVSGFIRRQTTKLDAGGHIGGSMVDVETSLSRQLARLGYAPSVLVRLLRDLRSDIKHLDGIEFVYLLLNMAVSEDPTPPPDDATFFEMTSSAADGSKFESQWHWPVMEMVIYFMQFTVSTLANSYHPCIT